MDTFLRNLNHFQKRSGLVTQAKLSEASRVSQTHISNLLRAEKLPGMAVMEKLAAALGVEVWQLLAPSALVDRAYSKQAAEIIEAYAACDESGKATIHSVALAQAGAHRRQAD